MRLLGLLLIIVGALLCASIAWIAIGFLAMALGLICLQIPIKQVPMLGHTGGTNVVSPPSTEHIAASASQNPTLKTAARRGAWKEEFSWDSLVARDEDLANVERLLSRYGATYVDQLRALYGIFNNKALLPSILSLIVESARYQEGRAASALAGTSAAEGGKPDSTLPKRIEQPIEAVNSIVVPSATQNSTATSSNDEEAFLDHSQTLPSADVASQEGASEASATADVEDVANFTTIFDQMSRNKN